MQCLKDDTLPRPPGILWHPHNIQAELYHPYARISPQGPTLRFPSNDPTATPIVTTTLAVIRPLLPPPPFGAIYIYCIPCRIYNHSLVSLNIYSVS